MKENGFIFKKKKKRTRSRRYLAEIITDLDDTDYLALHANTPAKAKSLPYSQEQAARGFGLYVNSHKTQNSEFKCFN